MLFVLVPLTLVACDSLPGSGTPTHPVSTAPLIDISPSGNLAAAGGFDSLFDEIVVADESLYGTDYLGHPDSVLLDNGDILTAFPLGHGKGETEMVISHDGGLTWGNIFDEDNPKPSSFSDTQETPTLYKLDFTDGTQKLVCISGRPSWPTVLGSVGEGFDVTVSESLDENGSCDGLVWSEHENFYGPNAVREEYKRFAGTWDVVVGMSSLTQLKDEDGNYIDKWMGTFHDDRTFVVYKTYLTFDEDGTMDWSEPERLLGDELEWREYERRFFGGGAFCEVEIIRSPDGGELAALFRVNNKNSHSFVSFSTDEGETWSEPQTVSAELTGERHKAEYDPATGKLVITFRSVYYKNTVGDSWYSKGWVAWIGDYDDLKTGAAGDAVVKLAHTYGDSDAAGTEANADTGYAGLVIYPDGLVVTCSYGTFSPADDPTHGGDTYIVAKRFTLRELVRCSGVTIG